MIDEALLAATEQRHRRYALRTQVEKRSRAEQGSPSPRLAPQRSAKRTTPGRRTPRACNVLAPFQVGSRVARVRATFSSVQAKRTRLASNTRRWQHRKRSPPRRNRPVKSQVGYFQHFRMRVSINRIAGSSKFVVERIGSSCRVSVARTRVIFQEQLPGTGVISIASMSGMEFVV